ncbi:hypothetical protein MKX07_002048 [Trichoderma sp. CBMAI-0711]|nr:hypothetical protein MKX07_002048 [Trichoderma sp. CBMAI-0711]
MSAVDSESRLSDKDESQLSAPPPLSDLDSSDSDSDSEPASSSKQEQEPEPEPVEWLATSRSRRSTAGNRMKSMLANEEPDSDLELLFAESDNDQGFSDAGDDASDVQMDSSSDDEDDNNAAADELEGERELERQARERRAAQRKRKAQDGIPAKFRKKVRITAATATATATASDTSTPAPAPAPRPKKKSERASWLPSPADLPTRASSRKTTRMSKEQLHQQMIEREERRLRQLELMQKKAARMEALKKPPMTQEDRLREAAIVEKRNSKSLNRWEVAEKQREEERRAKLAALSQRTLQGPVLTFWTGLGEARRVVEEEEKPKRRRVEKKDKDKDAEPKPEPEPGKDTITTTITTTSASTSNDPAAGKQGKEAQQQPDSSSDKAAAATASGADDAANSSTLQPTADAADRSPAVAPLKELKQEEEDGSMPQQQEEPPKTTPDKEEAASSATVATLPPPPHPPLPHSGLAAPVAASLSGPPRQMSPLAAPAGMGSPRPIEAGKPSGVLAPPILAPPPAMSMDYRPSAAPKSNVLALPLPQATLAPPAPPPHVQTAPGSTAGPAHVSTEPVLRHTVLRPIIPDPDPVSKSASPSLSEPPSQPAPGAADVPEAPETTTRNVIIFQNFDENALQDKSIQTQILFGRKMNRLNKPPSTPNCIITNLPARYRDPKTGLPYHNVAAYRELQRLQRGELSWSRILNAWVGSQKVAADGVPARFLDPNAPTKSAEEREKERLAQIRAVPPQPQPQPQPQSQLQSQPLQQQQQQHQAPPPAVVAAAHNSEELTSSLYNGRMASFNNRQPSSSHLLNSTRPKQDQVLFSNHRHRSNSSSSSNGLHQTQPPIYLLHKHKPLHSNHPSQHQRHKRRKHRHRPPSQILLLDKARRYLLYLSRRKPSLLLLLHFHHHLKLQFKPNLSRFSLRTKLQEEHTCLRINNK